MLGVRNTIITFIIGSAIVLGIAEDPGNISVVRQYEELNNIEMEYLKALDQYISNRVNEINTLLSTSSNRWNFISSVQEIKKYWIIDINERLDLILSKLSDTLNEKDVNESYENLKNQYNVHLKSAKQFWQIEVDNKLQYLRRNPNTFKDLVVEPVVTTETPPLKLSAEHQAIFNAQMKNLTDIATAIGEIIGATFDQMIPIPELPNINDITYISKKTKFDMLKSKTIKKYETLVDSARNYATESVSGDWRIQGKNGPTQQEFDKEYNYLCSFATVVVRDLKERIQKEFELVSK